MPASPLGQADVGTRVTLRVHGSDGPTDLVGTLLAATATELTVRRRNGQIVTVAASAVTHGRVVPPGPAQLVGVDELHAVMAGGWQAVETERIGDWLLRASAGFTRRGNSALPVGDPGMPLDRAVEQVEQWYVDRGLPPRLQIPDHPPTRELLHLISGRGWDTDSAAHVMTAELVPLPKAAMAGPPVTLAAAPDDAWTTVYRSEAGPLPATAGVLLTNHPQVVFVSVRDGARCVAIARATVDDRRWAGLFAVEVAHDRRRQGAGRAVSLAALQWAGRHGARRAYLQTEVGNEAAVALYRSLGFDVHHDYRHWVRRQDDQHPDRK